MSEVYDYFWSHARPMLEAENIDEGTLMGFPCIRVNSDFFAAPEHKTGSLIVKLPKNRVQQLIEQGIGFPFAPAGKVFKEWVLIEERDDKIWKEILEEAKNFVASKKKK
ncbi:MAG: hypothetical protein AAFP70_08160 [Calditrichota bacterium]